MSATADTRTHTDRLLTALLDGDRPAAEAVIDTATADGVDGLDLLDELLAPAMHEVGRRWEAGEITIADEHLATVTAHAMLTRIYPRLVSAAPRSRGTVLLAGADGEQHVFGLRMVADALEGAGFAVHNTGGSLPPASLAAAVTRVRPALVGLAGTICETEAVRRSIAAVRSVDPELPILLGGHTAVGAVALEPRVVACASARAAVDNAVRLLQD